MKHISFKNSLRIEILLNIIKYFVIPILLVVLAYFTWIPAIVISWGAIIATVLYIGLVFSDIKYLFVFSKLNKIYHISKKEALTFLIDRIDGMKGTGNVDNRSIAAMREKDLDRQYRVQSFGQKIDSKRGVRMGKMASSSGASQRNIQKKYKKLYDKLDYEIESEKPKSEFF